MNFPQRKTIRLQHYDYSQNGLYFITICIQDRLCLLGNVVEHQTHLSPQGKMIEKYYLSLEEKFPVIKCLDYVVMPNHIHFIIQIDNNGEKLFSLFDVIQYFKSVTTREYIKQVKLNDWQSFHRKLWQRSYYEHIIRDEKDYFQIAEYIKNNPITWALDKLYITG